MKIPTRLAFGQISRGRVRRALLVGPLVLVSVGLIFLGARRPSPAVAQSDASVSTLSELTDAPEVLSRHALALAAAEESLVLADTSGAEEGLPKGLTRYRVQQGDTLWDIALKYGTSMEAISASNQLGRGDLIGPGKDLLVPTEPGFAYKVKSGDSIAALGTRFNISESAIAAANGLDSTDAVIQPGQLLFLAGAKPPSLGSVGAASTSRGGTVRSSGSGWLWPARGPITSYFGTRWGRTHEGIDLGVGTGTAVRAARGGRVVKSGWGNGYGKRIMISHGDGFSTLYAHLSQIDVNVGDQVEAGQVIGLSGNTGNSTGPHLHFEVQVNGVQQNPLSYLP